MRILCAPLTQPIKRNHVLVKILYAGVNASDVNFSSGRYFSGKDGDIAGKLPFDAGFEAVGIIAAVGDDVVGLNIGSAAAVMTYGSYAEFMIVPSKFILPVARPDPEVVAMLTSGLTASIALEQAAQMGSQKTVMITAAAGGTGQFAVQLAKLGGNKVIATCGGKDKAMLLESLGVDRVINYRDEDIKTVSYFFPLFRNYPHDFKYVLTCFARITQYPRVPLSGTGYSDMGRTPIHFILDRKHDIFGR